MTAALKANTYDNIPEGATVDATNSATSGNAIAIPAWTTATNPAVLPTHIATVEAAAGGGRGLKIVATAVADVITHQLGQTASLTAVYGIAFKVDSVALPNGSHTFFRSRNSTGNVIKGVLNASKVASLQTGAGGAIMNFNGGAALPDGYYFMTLSVSVNSANTAAGTIQAALYLLSTKAQIGSTFTSSAITLGTTGVVSMQWGKPEGTGAALPNGFYMDFPSFDVGTTTLLAVPTLTPSEIPNLGVDKTFKPWDPGTLTGAASVGTISSYTFTQVGGPAVVLSGTGATRTYSTPLLKTGATLTFRLTVNGGTAYDEVVHTILPVNEFSGDGLPLRLILASDFGAITTPVGGLYGVGTYGVAVYGAAGSPGVAINTYDTARYDNATYGV